MAPHLNVFAGTDPYRSSATREIDYVKERVDAGVDGFFTQPFFDLRLPDICMEQLEDLNVSWGISPVTSDRSRSYWESKSEAMFPKTFSLNYQNSVEPGRSILKRACDNDSNVYFMPIRTEPIR